MLDAVLVGCALLLPFAAVSIELLRAAGRGARGAFDEGTRGALAVKASVALALSVPVAAALAALLKSATHHRGLGGATFGAMGLALVVGAAVVAHRAHAWNERLVARGWSRGALTAAAFGGSAVLVALALSPLARPASAHGVGVAAALVDGFVALAASAAFARLELGGPWGIAVARFGLMPVALVVVVAGWRVERAPASGRAITESGGLAGALLGRLDRWTDHDGDGRGAHFGGGDCDDGDVARYPGATDIPGDGVDQDCDGADASAGAIAPARGASSSTPAASAASATPSAAGSVAPVDLRTKPNLVLVTLDTVGYAHTSLGGAATTPRLAALAKEGVSFSRAYATGVEPLRALTPLVTGQRLADTKRDRRPWPTLAKQNKTLAERLRAAGYVTAAVTSFHWLSRERGFAQGFDRFEEAFRGAHPERGVTGPGAVRAASAIVEELESRAQPLFLWVHLFDAHEKYLVHKGRAPQGEGKLGAYRGEVAFVDEQLGTLLDALGKTQRASNLVVVVVGSHGEAFGEHDQEGHGESTFDEAVRVPLVMSGAGLARGEVRAEVASVLGVAPTLLTLGAASLDGVAGESLLGPGVARAALVEAPAEWAVVEGALKLVLREGESPRLFDLGPDPGEKTDVASQRAADVERLRKLGEALRAPATERRAP